MQGNADRRSDQSAWAQVVQDVPAPDATRGRATQSSGRADRQQLPVFACQGTARRDGRRSHRFQHLERRSALRPLFTKSGDRRMRNAERSLNVASSIKFTADVIVIVIVVDANNNPQINTKPRMIFI